MEQVAHWVRVGGFAMFPILLLGLVGLVGAVVGIVVSVTSRRRGLVLGVGVALLGVALLCVGAGALSYLVGQQRIEAALAGVNPDIRAELRAVGESEARVPLAFGAGAGALPALTGLVLVALGVARGRPPTAAR